MTDKEHIEQLEAALRIACDWLDSYEVEGVPKLRAVLASENAEEFISTYSDPAVRKAVNETVQQALAPEGGAEVCKHEVWRNAETGVFCVGCGKAAPYPMPDGDRFYWDVPEGGAEIDPPVSRHGPAD